METSKTFFFFKAFREGLFLFLGNDAFYFSHRFLISLRKVSVLSSLAVGVSHMSMLLFCIVEQEAQLTG